MRRQVVSVLAVVVLVSIAGCVGDPAPAPSTSPADSQPESPPSSLTSPNGTLEVHFINVGQAESALIVGPTNETMLVDSGDFTDDGEYVLQYLRQRNISRIVAFKLNGDDELPPAPPLKRTLNPPPSEVSDKVIAEGNRLYHQHCASCHGFNAISGGVVPDLRYSSYLNNFSWYDIVVRGALQSRGMVSFGNTITRDQATAIREYVIARAHESQEAQAEGGNGE
jgi:mono/diheme cytochrome c family protein